MQVDFCDHTAPLSEPLEYQWLFLDLNSYFASVEQQDKPALRGKPIAVVPLGGDSTCAIAASYEAKKFGIKTGTRIYEARRLCPNLICVPARHDIYVTYHHKILDEVIKHIPINKVWSIDELSSRLPPNKRNYESAVTLAKKVKAGLKANIGDYIRCSIGIAPNSFLAKVATDMMKPDGLVVLNKENLVTSLFSLKLMDLPGINIAMNRRLMRAGIYSIEDFYNIAPKHARKVWGSVEGERFWYQLHGYDLPDPITHSSMIGHSRILDPELRRPDMAKLVARRLTVKAAGRLRRNGFFASDFALSVRQADGMKYKFSMACRLICPAQDNFSFLAALDNLWQEMLDTLNPNFIKKVAVTLTGLYQNNQITPDLFAQEHGVSEQSEKFQNLSLAMDTINQKFGAEAVRLGISPKTQAGYVGTKIAFHRIPDLTEFQE